MLRTLTIGTALLTLSACGTIYGPDTKAKIPLAPQAEVRMPAMGAKELDISKPLTRIALGSCLSENENQRIFTHIVSEKPDLFLFLGDNVYGDAKDDDPRFSEPNMPKMMESYTKLSRSWPFAQLRNTTPMMITWDDHDYGLNDGGKDFVYKARAQELFTQAWDLPWEDMRRHREGVFTSKIIGPEGQRVQVIMLDTRTFRTDLTKTDDYGAPGKERYIPSTDESGTMLGEEQWLWLESELNKPVDLRIIASSVQVLADGHGWEAWRTMPHEQERLFNMLAAKTTGNTILVSGDRHLGAIYQRDNVAPFPVVEMTSSSLNLPASKWREERGETSDEAGPYRISEIQYESNYGLIDIDWTARKAKLRLITPTADNLDIADTREAEFSF